MNHRIYPTKLPYQKNALRVEAIVPGARCALMPDAPMRELLKTRFMAVMSNPSMHWQNFRPCDQSCECGVCPVSVRLSQAKSAAAAPSAPEAETGETKHDDPRP